MATAHPKARLTAGSSCLGMLAVGANGTAIMAAIPTIRRDIGLDAGELEWAINAYLLASAACIVLGGKIADRAGARGVAVFGLVLFAAASASIAMAGSPTWLLAGRALQGLGAAFAVPGTLAAVGTASDKKAAWAEVARALSATEEAKKHAAELNKAHPPAEKKPPEKK